MAKEVGGGGISGTCVWSIVLFSTFDKMIHKPKHLKTFTLKGWHFQEQTNVLTFHEIIDIIIECLEDMLWKHNL